MSQATPPADSAKSQNSDASIPSPTENPLATLSTSELLSHVGWGKALLGGLVSSIVSGFVAYLFLFMLNPPQPVYFEAGIISSSTATLITVIVLGFLLGVVGVVDYYTHLIKDTFTVGAGIILATLVSVLAFASLPNPVMSLLIGVLSGVGTFIVFLVMVMFTGFASGGDIKFSPIPAFVLGVFSFMYAVFWIFLAFLFTLVIILINKRQESAFGTGMALALPVAVALTAILHTAVGLPL